MSDPYVYSGTELLINKLDIRDPEKFKIIEAGIYGYASVMLPIPKGQFDYDHLKKIHQHLFGDAYEWAGQERVVDISKGTSHFARKEFIETELNKVFSKLKTDHYLKDLKPDEFCKKMSYYFKEINAAHPFREGKR